jgi:hypothetical protein
VDSEFPRLAARPHGSIPACAGKALCGWRVGVQVAEVGRHAIWPFTLYAKAAH